MKKTGYYGYLYDFSVDYDVIEVNDILDIYKDVRCSNVIFGCNTLKCVSMNNQECKVRPVIMNINSNETLCYFYSILADKCDGSFNGINNF